MAFRIRFKTCFFLPLSVLIQIVCISLVCTSAVAASPRSSRQLESQIQKHRKEYERLHRLWLKNQKLEKKYQTKGYDLTFQVLELKMDKEKLHVQLEQSHLKEIRFARELERLNREIHSERKVLKTHAKTARTLREDVLSLMLARYLEISDGSPESRENAIRLEVTGKSYGHVRDTIEADRFNEEATRLEVAELDEKRQKILALESRRKEKETREEQKMSEIRDQLMQLEAKEQGIQEKDKAILEKTQHLLSLINRLERESLKAKAGRRAVTPIHLRLKTLKWPIRGPIVERFGTFHDGIDIQTKNGSPVHSTASGRVLFARHYSGYGNLVIINHGSHVYSLYGHLKRIVVREGELIGRGKEIGIAGGGGTLGRTTVFFGLTHGGNPVNPVPYLER